MYSSDLKDISFNLSEDYYKIQKDYFNQDFIQYENKCTYQEKLNLTLRISYELIDEIYSDGEVLRIDACEDIKKDIYVEKKSYYRIFGQVVDSKEILYKDVLVKVFKYKSYYGTLERAEVDKVFTNEYGEFNFVIEINKNTDLNSYGVEIDNYYKSL